MKKNAYQGWVAQDNHSMAKSFHFATLEPMKEFCLSLLLTNHDKSTLVSACEFPETQDVTVEIHLGDYETEGKELIKTIESFYEKNIRKNNENYRESRPSWSEWFQSLHK